ncbi:MAG: hypothetical protein HYX94_04650 [Chloroflexi bacterium]|nr:hypothetical protein [Chloroflexota bacterium]
MSASNKRPANEREENVRQQSLQTSPEKKQKFSSLSGHEAKPLYTPADSEGKDYLREIGFPGQLPFTRGKTAIGYRSFAWHRDSHAGCGLNESGSS